MSDEIEVTETVDQVADADAQEPKTYTQDEFEEEVKGLKRNQQKAIDEAKKAKAEAAELRRIQQEAQRKAMEEKEDFQGLYSSSKEELKAAQEERDQLREMLRADKVDGNAVKIAAKIGIDEASQELLAEQAKKFIAFEDGNAIYKIGGVEVSKDEVIKTLSEKYPRLVRAQVPSGSGARPSTGSGAAITGNPWKKDSLNLTEQGRIMKTDPVLAQKLINEAK